MEHAPKPEIDLDKNTFFDPKLQPVPELVFGFDGEWAVDAAQTVGRLALYTPYEITKDIAVAKHGYKLYRNAEDIARVAPLVERISDGEVLQPQDVRPYRKSIKAIIRHSGTPVGSRLGKADRLFAALSVVGIGIPLRRKLNARIEQEFIARAPQIVQDAKDYARKNIDKLEPYVKILGGYKNPQAEVRREVGIVNTTLKRDATTRARKRGSPTVSSVDFATALQDEVAHSSQHPERWRDRLPLLNSLFPFRKTSRKPTLPDNVMGVAAPEIVQGLDLFIPEDQRDRDYVYDVMRLAHPDRWLAEKFKSTRMGQLRIVTTQILPDLVNIIPVKGQEVITAYNHVKDLLKK